MSQYGNRCLYYATIQTILIALILEFRKYLPQHLLSSRATIVCSINTE